MEKQLRSVLCPDHNLRYDPTQSDGCVRCMRLLGTTAAGRTAYPAAPAATPAASAGPGGVMRGILIALLVLGAVGGTLLTRSVRVDAPDGAYVDDERAFALVVPPRWKIVDPSTVTYLHKVPDRASNAATLISDRGRLGPTIRIDVIDKWPGRATASKIADFEKGFREGFGNVMELDMKAELAVVDRIRSMHGTAVASLSRTQKVSLDQYIIPGDSRAYIITAVALGEKREQTAEAARAVADGFRVLARPPVVQGKAEAILWSVLLGGLVVIAKMLATSS